jgi:hypothetical protein
MSIPGLVEKIERLHRALVRAKISHAFGGAVALAYYATPRATIDVDLNVFLPPDRYPDVVKALRRAGVDSFPDLELIRRDGQGRARWAETPVDLFFSYDEVHEAMREWSREVPFSDATIPILGPEHLLVAKAVFNRSKDWLDIEQMLIAADDLDRVEVDRCLDHLVGRGDPRAVRVAEMWSTLRGTA